MFSNDLPIDQVGVQNLPISVSLKFLREHGRMKQKIALKLPAEGGLQQYSRGRVFSRPGSGCRARYILIFLYPYGHFCNRVLVPYYLFPALSISSGKSATRVSIFFICYTGPARMSFLIPRVKTRILSSKNDIGNPDNTKRTYQYFQFDMSYCLHYIKSNLFLLRGLP